jgi:hypothetical protein
MISCFSGGSIGFGLGGGEPPPKPKSAVDLPGFKIFKEQSVVLLYIIWSHEEIFCRQGLRCLHSPLTQHRSAEKPIVDWGKF